MEEDSKYDGPIIVECGVCFINFESEVEKTSCDYCASGWLNTEQITQRRLDIMEKASAHRLPQTLRDMYYCLSRK